MFWGIMYDPDGQTAQMGQGTGQQWKERTKGKEEREDERGWCAKRNRIIIGVIRILSGLTSRWRYGTRDSPPTVTPNWIHQHFAHQQPALCFFFHCWRSVVNWQTACRTVRPSETHPPPPPRGSTLPPLQVAAVLGLTQDLGTLSPLKLVNPPSCGYNAGIDL